MALGVTTGQAIVAEAKYRADMVNGTFITSAEWATYVNSSYRELYDILIQKYGDDWFVPSSPATPAGYAITADGTNDHYALPADFYHLLGADLVLSGTALSSPRATMRPFAFGERNDFQSLAGRLGRSVLRYRLKGGWIWFKPLPASGTRVELWYLPRLADLTCDGVAGTDTVDGVSGWEEYIIVDAAIKARMKEETDVSGLLAAKAALIARIEASAENRDAGSPAKVVDVHRHGFDGPDGGGWW